MKKLFYSPSFHPSYRWVCFFMTDLEKVSITAIVHPWILCGEWVPSGMRVQTADKKHHKKSTIDWHFGKKQWLLKCPNDLFLTNTQLFTLQAINWWTGVMWITCGLLWCFTAETAEDPLVSKRCIVHFSKSVLINRQTPLHHGTITAHSTISAHFHFGVNYSIGYTNKAYRIE